MKVAGDGHCPLHAVRESLQSEGILDITHDARCAILWQEFQDHKDYSTEYLQATSDVGTDITKYIKEKSYNNESGDIIVPTLCNALEISAIIYVHKDGQTNIIAHGQSRKRNFRGDIYLGLSTDEVDSHYNWLKKTSTPVIDSVQQGNDTVVQRFSPETTRPHPKAPPRKQAANRQKKRKTAILIDTPEKNEIERQSHEKKNENV